MKKIFFAALALVALTSCTQDEILSTTDNNAAIAFDNAFVNNATRANDLSKDNLDDFGVYGSVTNSSNQTGLIFNNQKVAGSAGNYTYSPVQYWIANASYNFTAIAPYAEAKWSYNVTDGKDAQNGTIKFDNAAAEANQDLLFATQTANTPATITKAPAKVAFTFNHILSRVKFTFVNDFATGSNMTIKVTDVTVTNAAANGTIAVNGGALADDWTTEAVNNDYSKLFGAAGTAAFAEGITAETEHFYFIPANRTYNVTFHVELFQAGVSVGNYDHNVNFTADLTKGMSYNIVAKISNENVNPNQQLYPIEFDVTKVEEWDSDINEDENVDENDDVVMPVTPPSQN